MTEEGTQTTIAVRSGVERAEGPDRAGRGCRIKDACEIKAEGENGEGAKEDGDARASRGMRARARRTGEGGGDGEKGRTWSNALIGARKMMAVAGPGRAGQKQKSATHVKARS